jgi:Outer membrane protein beta-barrel domain
MKQFVYALVIVCGVCAGVAQDAQAQTGAWADRGYLNIGFGVESGSSSLTDTQNITIYEEAGTITSSTTWTSGSLIDAGFGVRVWRNMTVGLAYHQEENDTDSAVTGSIPSPIFFNQPRQLNEAVVLERKEKALHLVLGWVLPINEKLDVLVSGGPSFFRLEQDSVEPFDSTDVREGGSPFTTVTVDIDRITQKKSLVGFNVGVDATYIFWSNDDIRIGGGGFVRFTQASGDIQLLSAEQSTDVGGVQFGFGARVRF